MIRLQVISRSLILFNVALSVFVTLSVMKASAHFLCLLAAGEQNRSKLNHSFITAGHLKRTCTTHNFPLYSVFCLLCMSMPECYALKMRGIKGKCLMSASSPGNALVEQKTFLSLGQQAVSLRDSHDRLKALRRVTSTAQILLAYSMVMRALSQTASRYVCPELY